MTARRIARLLGALVVTSWALLLSAPVPSASAQPCPDVEVVFARGTGEPPGVGGVGQAFVDALRSQAGGKSVDVYPVNYPASSDFGDRIEFAETVVKGSVTQAPTSRPRRRTAPTPRWCSADFPKAPSWPVSSPRPSYRREYLLRSYLRRCRRRWLTTSPRSPCSENRRINGCAIVGAPPVVIGPLYAAKTIDLCAPGDTICDGTPGGPPSPAHGLYALNGMVDNAAAFAAGRL